MGKPATTYFCTQGHLVEDNPHHCFGHRDFDGWYSGEAESEPCPYCGSEVKTMICDFWDDPAPVVKTEDIQQTDHLGNTYYIQVEVYDMKELTTEDAS